LINIKQETNSEQLIYFSVKIQGPGTYHLEEPKRWTFTFFWAEYTQIDEQTYCYTIVAHKQILW